MIPGAGGGEGDRAAAGGGGGGGGSGGVAGPVRVAPVASRLAEPVGGGEGDWPDVERKRVRGVPAAPCPFVGSCGQTETREGGVRPGGCGRKTRA